MLDDAPRSTFVDNRAQRHQQNRCCFGTLVALFVFLMIFFLVPRDPAIYLKNISADSSDNIYGGFEFKNLNYFGVHWKDMETNLYWLPYDVTVLTTCYTGSEDCSFYYFGSCAIKLGSFDDNSKFSTNSRDNVNRKVELTQTEQELACSKQMIVNSANNNYQNLMLKGSIHAKSETRNFGKVHVRKSIYRFG